MKEHNKRWLLSTMQTSGSRRRHLGNGSYAEDRNQKIKDELEDLPLRESYKKSEGKLKIKLNYSQLKRFLGSQVGNDWNLIYSEIVARIPTKLLVHKEVIFWFVADKVEMIEGKPFNKTSSKFIWTPEVGEKIFGYDYLNYYVHPETNKLVKVL